MDKNQERPEWFNKVAHSTHSTALGVALWILIAKFAGDKSIFDYSHQATIWLVCNAIIYGISGVVFLIQKKRKNL